MTRETGHYIIYYIIYNATKKINQNLLLETVCVSENDRK
jgi:hypothetical protein